MSQCSTAAQCLKELARVMEQFGITDIVEAINSDFIKRPASEWNKLPNFVYPELWSFAIAEVEGKPVFLDSPNLYHKAGSNIPVSYIASNLHKWSWSDFSWNPPKPKTIMVEMNIDDVRYIANTGAISIPCFDACRKALEREGVK